AAAPKTSILVISIADQAKLENGEIRSNSNIKRIREAQRIAAKRANVAFWDLYEAMGGENSAINWATQNPPLMSSDYTHFSVQGQQLVGKMIYEVLLKAYQDFQARKIISQ
ncbi:MAG: hypothetical protein NZ108_07735, partial [Bacteroidia bacterium]|nr:hypothetical protein [Bacteroidia bacterium]